MADYKVTLPKAYPIMVRAANRAQAIRYATHKLVTIEILTTDEAIRLAKLGQELHDATGMEPEPEQPLLDPPAKLEQPLEEFEEVGKAPTPEEVREEVLADDKPKARK